MCAPWVRGGDELLRTLLWLLDVFSNPEHGHVCLPLVSPNSALASGDQHSHFIAQEEMICPCSHSQREAENQAANPRLPTFHKAAWRRRARCQCGPVTGLQTQSFECLPSLGRAWSHKAPKRGLTNKGYLVSSRQRVPQTRGKLLPTPVHAPHSNAALLSFVPAETNACERLVVFHL